jgi:hypothetical protein
LRRFCCVPRIADIEEVKQLLKTHLQKYREEPHINKRGSFQKFCTLYGFSLKMNLFYKIHLQAFNVISIVLYHSGPTFGQVLYSCLKAFVVETSVYSGHLIRQLLNASEAFPTE